MASGGAGGTTHMVGELIKVMTGVDMRHVPYSGACAALAALLVGKAHVMLDLIPSTDGDNQDWQATGTCGYLDAAFRRASEHFSPERFCAWIGGSVWGGIGVSRSTPAEIIAKLNSEINSALLGPSIRMRIAEVGYTPFASSPADFGKFIADETEVRRHQAGLRPIYNGLNCIVPDRRMASSVD